MTLAAHAPLDDAFIVAKLLEDHDDDTIFRINWVAFCALMRTIGHVLDKVDGAQSAHRREVVDRRWVEWKSHRDQHSIFWEFIEDERNAILKEYEFGYQQGDVWVGVEGPDGYETHRLDAGVYRPMLSDRFVGEDARDIAQEALQWWRHELSVIERELSGMRERSE
jgi:hypothetical protein